MARTALLRDALAHLSSCLGDGDELIVAEAGGNAAAAVLEGLRPVAARLVHLTVDPPGKCRQLNAAIRMAQGEVLLLTDDDVRVPSGWADAMAAPFVDPQIGLACGRVRGLSRVPGVEEDPGLPPGPAPVEPWRFAHGAAMAVRRRAAAEAGGFDERLGPGTPACGEDHDFVLRVRAQGWRVVIANADPVVHMDWRSAQENRRNALAYERGGGAVVGAALRRSPNEAWPVFRRRLGYQRSVFTWNRRFGPPALGAFAAGMLYGLRLGRRDWLSDTEGAR
jgi:GT2 family glycosyltransferase